MPLEPVRGMIGRALSALELVGVTTEPETPGWPSGWSGAPIVRMDRRLPVSKAARFHKGRHPQKVAVFGIFSGLWAYRPLPTGTRGPRGCLSGRPAPAPFSPVWNVPLPRTGRAHDARGVPEPGGTGHPGVGFGNRKPPRIFQPPRQVLLSRQNSRPRCGIRGRSPRPSCLRANCLRDDSVVHAVDKWNQPHEVGSRHGGAVATHRRDSRRIPRMNLESNRRCRHA